MSGGCTTSNMNVPIAADSGTKQCARHAKAVQRLSRESQTKHLKNTVKEEIDTVFSFEVLGRIPTKMKKNILVKMQKARSMRSISIMIMRLLNFYSNMAMI